MKQFITFVRKEFLHIFRDSRTMLILLGMPMVQMLLFGFAITTEVRNTKVAVFDPSQSMETRAIKERFDASEYFTIAEEIRDVSRINDVFKYGEIGLVMVFSDDFENELHKGGDAAVQLITDGTEPNQASMITGYASNILAQSMQELSESSSAPCRIIPEIRMLYNPQAESAYNFVPGVMGMILMLICAMMTSIAIVREKENGTMEILLVSPMKPIYIILSKVTPYFTLSMVNLITILLLSVYVLEVPIAGSLTDCRQSATSVVCICDIHLPGIVARPAYLQCSEYSGGSHARIRNGTYDARHAPFRSDISCRKHATSTTEACPFRYSAFLP